MCKLMVIKHGVQEIPPFIDDFPSDPISYKSPFTRISKSATFEKKSESIPQQLCEL